MHQNAYGRTPFERADGRAFREGLIRRFIQFFRARGYREEAGVSVTSNIDTSVRFIGSHISVLKPYLTSGKVPDSGVVITQECLRTQNRASLFDDSMSFEWGSYFPSIGALAHPDGLDSLCVNTHEYLTKEEHIDPSLIRIRISACDQDLLHAAMGSFGDVLFERDTYPDSYYRHRLGMPGIRGRNFNIALKDEVANRFSDIGNIIVIETDEGAVRGIELALGATTILKYMHGLQHVQDCYFVPGLSGGTPTLVRKLEDALMVSVVLFREKLQPIATGGRGRILRSYLRSMLYACAKLGIGLEQLEYSIEMFERNEFGEHTDVPSVIRGYLSGYHEALIKNGPVTKEDTILYDTLKKHGIPE